MEETEIIKSALEYVKASAGTGVDRTKLLSALRTLDGTPLSPDQKDFVFGVLTGRGWVSYYVDPLWHSRRWVITDKGMTALEAM